MTPGDVYLFRTFTIFEGGVALDLRKIGELGLLRRVRKWTKVSDPSLIQGIGDDVAVFETGRKVFLATTDILIEDIHFERTWVDPYLLGKKALGVNLSDIAAMGGTPKYFLLSLGLPKGLDLSFVSRFYRGLRDMAKPFRVDLIGGDTALSQKIIINICLLGEGEKKDLLYRNGAHAGDDLFVTGTLGDSALGLRILKKKGLKAKPEALVARHLASDPEDQSRAGHRQTAIGHGHDRCERRSPERYGPPPGGKRQRGANLGGPDSPVEALSKKYLILFEGLLSDGPLRG